MYSLCSHRKIRKELKKTKEIIRIKEDDRFFFYLSSVLLITLISSILLIVIQKTHLLELNTILYVFSLLSTISIGCLLFIVILSHNLIKENEKLKNQKTFLDCYINYAKHFKINKNELLEKKTFLEKKENIEINNLKNENIDSLLKNISKKDYKFLKPFLLEYKEELKKSNEKIKQEKEFKRFLAVTSVVNSIKKTRKTK